MASSREEPMEGLDLERRPTILLLNDEYGTSKGGISTINQQIGRFLRKANAIVFCTVLYKVPPEDDQACADEDGVQLITPVRPKRLKREPNWEWLEFYHTIHYPYLPKKVDFIIGHSAITSQIARNIQAQRYPSAKVILFTHVMPEDTDYYKGNEKAIAASEKSKAMVWEAENVHAVFAVGRRIYQHFKTKYRLLEKGKEPDIHYCFLPKPSQTFARTKVRFDEGQLTVLSVGRVRDVEKLKGHDLAARAMGKVAEIITDVVWLARGIDTDDYEKSKKILEDNLASGKLKPTLLPYGTQQEISEDIQQAHLVLMPSRAEPFGLVGLEAIAAGIPVLISDKSGLANLIDDLIKDKKIAPDHRHRIVETSVRDSDLNENAKVWAGKIVDTLKHVKSEFDKAAKFKKELIESKYWEESYRTLLSACGINAMPKDD
ncbi:sucrose synthase-like [Branchiostoma lanceolatum]|uniref:sucrose synthase-like n=1 Tax=Branchiostoma lanceolatum TaxID=7740 RepID=UPI003455B0E5